MMSGPIKITAVFPEPDGVPIEESIKKVIAFGIIKGGRTILQKTALYLRLSREDEERKNESQSILNQRAFLLRYAEENKFEVYDIYIDDGFTGTNFDRPGFRRMIADIEKGLIQIVLVKDLSRLGRDHIDTGYYYERYFPTRNVRFIAVNDGIDTERETVGNDMGLFKAAFNDFYAKDISKK